jgi:hypothetical protein
MQCVLGGNDGLLIEISDSTNKNAVGLNTPTHVVIAQSRRQFSVSETEELSIMLHFIYRTVLINVGYINLQVTGTGNRKCDFVETKLDVMIN